MASSAKKTSKATTAPKGRPTVARGARAARSPRRLSPTMEWVLAAVALVAVIGVLIFLFGDVRSTTHSGSDIGPAVSPAGSSAAPPAGVVVATAA